MKAWQKWLLAAVGIILLAGAWWLMVRPGKPEVMPVVVEPTAGPTAAAKVVGRWAVMADIHDDTAELAKALEMARRDGDNLVVMAGDLTNNGTAAEETAVKRVLDEAKINYAAIPGNHDIYQKVWVFGKKYQSLREGTLKLILIDNSNWRGLGDEQKKWLETETAECRKIECVAVMHMPLENSLSKHIMGEYSAATATEAGWLKNLLATNGVGTGYAGHLHYSTEYGTEGWQTVLVGAVVSGSRNTESPRFTEVTVDSRGQINNEVKLIE